MPFVGLYNVLQETNVVETWKSLQKNSHVFVRYLYYLLVIATNSTGATQRFSDNHKTRFESAHFGQMRVKSDWELMRKATWKWIATLLFTAKCCSFSSPKRQINTLWIAAQKFWKTDLKHKYIYKPNLGHEFLRLKPWSNGSW